MPYISNIPQPGDAKSISQGQILGNFLYLNDLVLGKNNFIKLPEQAAAPVTAANEMAIYTKDVAGVSAMFIRNEGAGTEVDITTAGKANNGWCKLPCDLLMVWGRTPVLVHNSYVYNYNLSVGFPGFSVAPYFIQATGIEVGAGSSAIYTGNPGIASVTIYNSGGTDRQVYIFAIGPA